MKAQYFSMMLKFASRTIPRIKGAGWTKLVLLMLVLIGSSAICSYRLSDPVGGFQDVNEVYYLSIAKNFESGSWLDPTADGKNIFVETPPLYSYLIYWLQWGFPSPTMAARSISAAAGLGSVILVFGIGRLLFTSGVGVLAAALFAFTPIRSVLGHNIQTDSLYLFLLLLAHWLYLKKSMPSGATSSYGSVGLAFGAACFTKSFAWISLPAWFLSETWRHRSLDWLRKKQIWIAAGIVLLIVAPFYLYHAVRDFDHLIGGTFHGAFSVTSPLDLFRSATIWKEVWWGFSPLLTLLFLLGFLGGVFRRDWQCRFLLLQASAFLLFFIFVHKHSYYLYSLTPFLALLTAALMRHVRWKWLVITGTAASVTTAAVLSVVMLCNVKYGFDEFVQIQKFYRAVCPDCPVLIENEMAEAYLFPLRHYLGAENLVNMSTLEAGPGGELPISSLTDRLLIFALKSARITNADIVVNRTLHAPVFFGWEIREKHPNPHLFRMENFSFRFRSKRSDSWTTFRIREVQRVATLGLVYVTKNLKIYKSGSSFSFRQPDVNIP